MGWGLMGRGLDGDERDNLHTHAHVSGKYSTVME